VTEAVSGQTKSSEDYATEKCNSHTAKRWLPAVGGAAVCAVLLSQKITSPGPSSGFTQSQPLSLNQAMCSSV
jgi:hypothetical protein